MCSCDQTPKLDSIASFRVEAEQTERKTSTSFVRLENVKFIICEPFCVQLDEPSIGRKQSGRRWKRDIHRILKYENQH